MREDWQNSVIGVRTYEVGRDEIVGVDDSHQCKWLTELRLDGGSEKLVDARYDPVSRQLPLDTSTNIQ